MWQCSHGHNETPAPWSRLCQWCLSPMSGPRLNWSEKITLCRYSSENWERGKWFLVLEERHPKTIILSVNVPDMKCKLPETPMYTKTQNRLGLRELSNAVRAAAECPWVSEYWIVLLEEERGHSPDNWWCLISQGPTSPATRTRPRCRGWATGSWGPLTWGSPASASGPRH